MPKPNGQRDGRDQVYWSRWYLKSWCEAAVVAVDRYALRRSEAQDCLLFYKTGKKNIKIN
jgi:hypothetical protein